MNLVVFAPPVTLVSGVVVDSWMRLNRHDVPGGGGVLADHRPILGSQGGGGSGLARAGHAF